MNLDDLKDRFASDARVTWERFQDSAIYNQLHDRYENMSPSMQKLTVAGVVAFIAFVILSVPYGSYMESQTYVDDFESKRMTIRELLKVSRESSDVPQIPQAPSMDSIRSSVENQIRSANLLPEQIKGTQVVTDQSLVVPQNLSQGTLQVNLAKLNARQALDLGYQFQNINPSVKLKDMTMSANPEDKRYFDVTYKLVALAVPAPPETNTEPPSRPGARSRNNNNGK